MHARSLLHTHKPKDDPPPPHLSLRPHPPCAPPCAALGSAHAPRVIATRVGAADSLLHRGGANTSPRLRTLLYLTFARPWFKDVENWQEPPPDATAGEGATERVVAAGTPPDALGERMLMSARMAPRNGAAGSLALKAAPLEWEGLAPLSQPLFPAYEPEAAAPIGNEPNLLQQWLTTQACPLAVAASSQPFMLQPHGLYEVEQTPHGHENTAVP